MGFFAPKEPEDMNVFLGKLIHLCILGYWSQFITRLCNET